MTLMQHTASSLAPAASQRLAHISQARRAILYGDGMLRSQPTVIEGWISASWNRCLSLGHQPNRLPTFATVAPAAERHTLESNRHLVMAAQPVLEQLCRAIAATRYFAILTDRHGIVVDASGAIDRSDRRADLITRIGTDLSEPQLATTAIGAALTELQPVWLHRGEHFFEANAIYSCAGAPLFGPDGLCVGMLDLTGIEAAERPELKHLVAQAARSIENALMLHRLNALPQRGGLLVRLNWPGSTLGDHNDGLVCVDADGYVRGANQNARRMVSQLAASPADGSAALHCSEVFAIASDMLFDAARHSPGSGGGSQPIDVPLWSGLRLQARASARGQIDSAFAPTSAARSEPARGLKDIETALIRKAVDDARGNVMQAARTLGISRATVYRRLGKSKAS